MERPFSHWDPNWDPKLSEPHAHVTEVTSYRLMADDLERPTAALADRYAVQRELGSGGMATVYLAHDIKHDRKVALMVLTQEHDLLDTDPRYGLSPLQF